MQPAQSTPRYLLSSLQILEQAKALIDTPEKWTKKAYAREKQDESSVLSYFDPKASCFCSLGALYRAGLSASCAGDVPRARRVLDRATGVDHFGFSGSIVRTNDHPDTTHTDIMAVFDRAIALCKEEAAI